MKILLRPNVSARSAFTMVEIALCLAIVGFALVAIIGVLPAGLNVQRENREETILNQDSTVWLDAIRSGSQGYDELTNYVDRIVVSNFFYEVTPTSTNLTSSGGFIAQHAAAGGITPSAYLTSGAKVVGLLSTPKIVMMTNGFQSNVVYAYCRAMSGGAIDKAPQQNNPDVRDSAFAYRMSVDIVPYNGVDPEAIATNQHDLVLRRNLSEVRLFMRWPLREPFAANMGIDRPALAGGANRMVFRSQASGYFGVDPNLEPATPGLPFYFIQPGQFR